MFLFHLLTLGVAGYALYRTFYPKRDPPGYNIDKNLDDMYPDLTPESSVEYTDHEACWGTVEDDWNAMTEDERKDLLDRELDEYYGRDTTKDVDVGSRMLLWAYLMGRSQGLKEKDE